MELMHAEQTELLRRAFYDVHNEVGLGRQEEAYHQALKLWFAENSLPVASRPPHRLSLRGVEAHVLFPDFVGWDVLSVEIKAVPRKLNLSEWVQVRDYMKCRHEALGLLVNFGLDRVCVERIIHTPQATILEENWEHWQGQITGADRELGVAVRDALRLVYAEHSTGYGLEVVSKLILRSMSLHTLPVTVNPIATATFRQQVVDESPLDCLIVDDRILIAFTSLFDSNAFNVSRGLSFMKALGLSWGVAVNFGRDKAEFQSLKVSSS